MPAPHPLVPNRRDFLGSALGFGSLAFGALNHHAHADRPHHRPRAKSVIWIFLSGGYSHLETFDPKPALNIHAGKTFDKAPITDPFKNPVLEKRSRSVIEKVRDRYPIIYPLQIGYKQHGQCGAGISDWRPHIARYADDIAFVRNMYTTDNGSQDVFDSNEAWWNLRTGTNYGTGLTILAAPTGGDSREEARVIEEAE